MLFRRITHALLIMTFCIHTPKLDAQGGYIDCVQRCFWGMCKKAATKIAQKTAELTSPFLTEVCSQQQPQLETMTTALVERQIPLLEESVTTMVRQNAPILQESAEQAAATIIEQHIPRLQETVTTTLRSQVPKLCYSALSTCVGLFGAYTSYKGILKLITTRTTSKNTLATLSFGMGALATSIITTHFLWKQPHAKKQI